MLAFVLTDFGLQRKHYGDYQARIARTGAEGLKIFLQSGRPLEDALHELSTSVVVTGYMGGQDKAIAIFDTAGNILYKSPGALSTNPAEVGVIARAPSDQGVEIRRVEVAGLPAVAAVTAFATQDTPAVRGHAVFIFHVAEQQQIGLILWSWRSVIVLIMIVGVMLAVRIPVKRFVVAPIDGLFMAAYAASKDDYKKLPKCPTDNEFAELYDMFDRLMGHLSDTRIPESENGSLDDDLPADPLE